jgi:hypothetical protein
MKTELREDREVRFILVRDKSRFLNALLSDLSRLEEEREQARKNKNKFVGISSDSYGGYSGSTASMSGFGRDDYMNRKNDLQSGDRYDPYIPRRNEEKPTLKQEPVRLQTEESLTTPQNIFTPPQITTKTTGQNLFQNTESLQTGNVRKLQAPPGTTLASTSSVPKATTAPDFLNFGTTQAPVAPQPAPVTQPTNPPASKSDLEGIFFTSPQVSFPTSTPQFQPNPQFTQPAAPAPTFSIPPSMPSYPSTSTPSYTPSPAMPSYAPVPTVPSIPSYPPAPTMPSYAPAPSMPSYTTPPQYMAGPPSYPAQPQPGHMGPALAMNYKWPTAPQMGPGVSNIGMQPQHSAPSNVKISHNMQGISEPSLSAIQSNPSLLTDFTQFQEAPKPQGTSKDIEASIVNLDSLAANPKKEAPHWSSHFHY